MKARTKVQRVRPTGPKTLTGSAVAKRQAVVILEVLSGVRDTVEGATVMGVSLTRYYTLETRALQGLITALEPRPRGRQKTAEMQVAELERERKRLERELTRSQALVRAAQRAVGLPARRSEGKGSKLGSKGKVKRRRRRVTRAAKAIAALKSPPTPGKGEACAPDVPPRG
jgi:hypothetical protein